VALARRRAKSLSLAAFSEDWRCSLPSQSDIFSSRQKSPRRFTRSYLANRSLCPYTLSRLCLRDPPCAVFHLTISTSQAVGTKNNSTFSSCSLFDRQCGGPRRSLDTYRQLATRATSYSLARSSSLSPPFFFCLRHLFNSVLFVPLASLEFPLHATAYRCFALSSTHRVNINSGCFSFS